MNANDVSILSEDAMLSGRVTGQDLTILGGFDGEVNVRGRLRLGPNAKVKAVVKAESVEVEGAFEGEIRTKVLAFAPSARARGLFLADRLAIRDGAMVEGAFNLAMESDARPAETKPETVAPMAVPAEAATVILPAPAEPPAPAAAPSA
jgi:cytoskeletal protein CcmA (bactofilin family)